MGKLEMRRDDAVLAALAAGGVNATFTPVQVQKLFFILDREAALLMGGPHFNFIPYDYGPFDKGVYDVLSELANNGLVQVQFTGRYNNYSLSSAGIERGCKKLGEVSKKTQSYLKEIANWIRSLSFSQLVAAIYNEYPEMKVNSVFRG